MGSWGRGGTGARNLGARCCHPATSASRAQLCADARRSPVHSPRATSPRRGREVPGRVPVAPAAGAPNLGAAPGRALAPRYPPPYPRPTRRRRPLAPPAARPPPAGSRRFPLAKLLGLSGTEPHRPSGRRPRGKAQPVAPLFYLTEFSRARSLALPPLWLARSFSFFPFFFFFALARAGRLFRSRRPRPPARALLPAGPGRAGRPAALPAPLHPRSGGGGGAAPRSDSFQYGTDAGRMRPRPPPTPPSSAVLRATRSPRLALGALTARPPRCRRRLFAGLELHRRGGVRGPGSIALVASPAGTSPRTPARPGRCAVGL